MDEIPFPVDGRYRIRADIAPLGPPRGREVGHLRPARDTDRYVAAKLDALERGARLLRGWAPERGCDAAAALDALVEVAALETPQHLRRTAHGLLLPSLGIEVQWDGVSLSAQGLRRSGEPIGSARSAGRAVAWLTDAEPEHRLMDAIALGLSEDFAVVRGPDGSHDRDMLELVHVCFPAGWTPSSKVGLPFDAVHSPVPANEPLRVAHPGLIAMMTQRGPFVRYVWGLHASADLCAAPELVSHGDDVDVNNPDAVAESTWFRTERQTLLAVPGARRAVFTIRTWTAPLRTVATTPERATALAESLRDMTPEVAAYKGVAVRRPALIAWLERRAAESVAPDRASGSPG